MAKKNRFFLIAILVGLLIAGIFAWSFVDNLVQYQRRRPEIALLRLVQAFNDRGDWIKGSSLAQNALRKYIHGLMNADEPWAVPLYLAEKKRPDYLVVAIGDSLTAGRKVDEDQRFVYFLEKLMAYHLPGKTMKIVNAGVPGNTIVAVSQRLDRDLIRLQPDLVILGLGFNDSRIIANVGDRYESLVPVETFRSTYLDVIRRIREKTQAKILLFSAAPVALDFESSLGDEYSEPQIQLLSDYVTAAESIALNQSCAFADVYGRMVTDPAYKVAYLQDGLHPNPIGNLMVARYLFESWLTLEGIEPKAPFLALIPQAIGRVRLAKSKVIDHNETPGEKPLELLKKWKANQDKQKADPIPEPETEAPSNPNMQ